MNCVDDITRLSRSLRDSGNAPCGHTLNSNPTNRHDGTPPENAKTWSEGPKSVPTGYAQRDPRVHHGLCKSRTSSQYSIGIDRKQLSICDAISFTQTSRVLHNMLGTRFEPPNLLLLPSKQHMDNISTSGKDRRCVALALHKQAHERLNNAETSPRVTEIHCIPTPICAHECKSFSRELFDEVVPPTEHLYDLDERAWAPTLELITRCQNLKTLR